MGVGGECHFLISIKIAWLALKHRKNRHQRQRIIVFVSSPTTETEKQLTKLGKQLRKNSVAIDVVLLGQADEQQLEILKKFVQAANKPTEEGEDNSHFCHF